MSHPLAKSKSINAAPYRPSSHPLNYIFPQFQKVYLRGNQI